MGPLTAVTAGSPPRDDADDPATVPLRLRLPAPLPAPSAPARTAPEHPGHDERPVAPAGRPRPRPWQTAVRGVGELLVTGGLVVLLFVAHQLWVTDWLAGQRQEELAAEIEAQWRDAGPAAAPGEGVPGSAWGVLHVPRLGEDWRRVVLEGTTEEQLSQGPGHYEGTAMPGEQGNVALAGHRVGRGSPFLELDRLVPGDAIVVETRDSWFTYRVLGDAATGDFTADPSGIPGQRIVAPSDVDVISPTPGASVDAPPTGAYLTLTTCHPRYSARQRLIVHAVLDGPATPKAQAPAGPPALRGA